MNRKLKKLAAALLTLSLLLLALPGQLMTAYAATGKITFSDPSVSVGNQVSVTMKIASSDGTGLGNSDVMLEYDASALEFVSGTNANGGAGSVRVVGSMESANQTTFSFTLKFKALKAGTTSITVKSQEVYDADSRTVTIEHVGSSAVKVNAPENSSTDASLSSLTISPGTLSPAFSADVTEYTATVSGDVERITVSAPANDSKASVVVEGAENLQLGENTVLCQVTAEDGATTKTYTITVTKVEGEASDGDDAAAANSPNGEAIISEGNWTPAETFDEEDMPEGFTATEYEYNGTQLQAAVNEQGVVLFYMTDENGNGDFFIYDAETGILAPYVTVRMAEKTIIVLPPEEIPEDVQLPEGFKECTIDIGDHTVHGWIWGGSDDGAPEYCMVYGQNADGEKNFYRYDQKEMTLQRYFQDPDAAELRTKLESVVEEYNSLVDDYEIRGYMIAGLFGVCILLVIILIILLLTRKPKNTYDSQSRYSEPDKPKKKGRRDYEEYEDYEDYEEYEKEPVRSSRTKKTQARAAARYEDEELDMIDLDEDEPVRTSAPVRQPKEKGRPQAAPRQAERPEKTVADVERDIASSLAKEARKASADKEAEDGLDDDFEFIDLDL